MPRAPFPNLITWCDGEGSQVPSVEQAGPRPPPWVVGSNGVPIQAGLHLASIFLRISGGRKPDREAGPPLEG